MNIIIEAIVYVLAGYLSLTTTLAGYIETWLPADSGEIQDSSALAEEEMIQLYSFFDPTFPDILLKSAAYQQAALGAVVGLSGGNTNNPLDALVNVFCTFETRDYIRTTTGTGFFIDADGIILTNAHIAQFLLLENTESFGETSCIVRSGSPAAPEYNVGLLYISPAWIEQNAAMVDAAVPMGTGERDYALLYVTSTIENEPLPAAFPALNFNSELLPTSVRGNDVVAAGYPATDLIAHGPSTALYARIASTSVSELYTFGSNYADIISVRGSEVGAEGASGGPVVSADGEVIAMITTRGNDEVDGPGSLRAITISHINRTIEEETGFTLEENLNGNLPERAQIFADTLTPFLVSLLEEGKNQ
ncbi:MAG TPA: serine protease [Candidatus Paceibacterota bacterium]